MADAGLLGRKTGAGWYRYEEGQPVNKPSPDFLAIVLNILFLLLSWVLISIRILIG